METNLARNLKSKLTLDEFFVYANTVEGRLEFIDGVPILMEGPTSVHQDIVEYLNECYLIYLRDKSCKVHFGRNVKLFKNKDDIRIPDLLVLCDSSKRRELYIDGAPDIVIEVWSKGNSQWERHQKLYEYMKAGVREIITVDYIKQKVISYNELNDFEGELYNFESNIPSCIFKDFNWCLRNLNIKSF